MTSFFRNYEESYFLGAKQSVTIFWKKLTTTLGYTFAAIIIAAGLLVSVSSLLTPVLNRHQTEIEQWVSRIFSRQVTISYMHLSWDVYEPELTLEQVTIYNKETRQPAVVIPKIEVVFSWWDSLLHWQPRMSSIKIFDVHLTLRQQPSGQLSVTGFPSFALNDKLTGQALNPNLVFDWIFTQPFLLLRDIDITFITKAGVQESITLTHLALQNSGTTHKLFGAGALNQEMPTSLDLKAEWKGDVTDLAHIRGHAYIYLDSISLSQWLTGRAWHNFSITKGIGSAKVWLEWDKNAWQKIQTTLQFYDFSATSRITKKDFAVDRFSGTVNWNRTKQGEEITGNDILLDLPNHLWPTDNFKVVLTRAPDDSPIIKSVEVDYLDLADTKTFLENAGLLPKSYQAIINTLNPLGEIRNIETDFNGPWKDLTSLAYADGAFSNISLEQWKNVPALSHLTGSMSWNGKQGKLLLNSQQLTVDFPHVFADPLQFDSVKGLVTWQKDTTNTWSLSAQKVQLANADVKAQVDMTLAFPDKASPLINLTGDFSVAHAEHVSRYLPLKTYEPGLVKWLQTAFLTGQAEDGKAILQGHLDDFPFDQKNSGVFNISAWVHDVGLLYAPDWPELQHINGKLVFSGRSMSVDIVSAQLQNITIGKVHADIPHFGAEQPTILNVNTLVQGDLAQGLQFINNSPLKNTIGKDLAALQLQGPMKLNFSLTIPLAKPEEAKVLGDTTITGANLFLPDWKLTLEKIQGEFRFTDEGIEANNLQGQIFGNPVSLTLTTEQSKTNGPHRVTANLAGNIDISALQTWLALPLDKVATGSTAYQAELHLAGHGTNEPTQVTVHSDLKGIALDLPDVYGKKAEDAVNFVCDITAKLDQPLQTKISYGRLLSVAMNLEKTANGIHLASGNLHLGSGAPSLPTQPGLILTGTVNDLNWDKLQETLAAKKDTSQNKPMLDPDLFRAVDITVNKVEALGLQLSQLHIQVNRVLNALQIKLSNPIMSGQITMPYHSNQRLIQARFQRLVIPTTKSNTTQSKLNPSSIPPLSFVGNDVRYGSQALGRITLNTMPSEKGLLVQELKLETTAAVLNATGNWKVEGNHSESHLAGNLVSQNVSKTLSAWGFSSANLVGSSGNVHFDLTWSGPIFDPSIANLSGQMSLKLGEGRIINLSDATDTKMDIGKLLNVFSLQTIPRRLSLDFSDVFEKGYSFDSLKGTFTLQKGNAMTQDTRFDGPIARVDIAGRIGLAAKDFDMKMSVTPYVTSSLPIVATLAGGPVVGLVTWAVGTVVSHAVSKATTYDYSVTGSWANPKWEQISTRSAEKPQRKE